MSSKLLSAFVRPLMGRSSLQRFTLLHFSPFRSIEVKRLSTLTTPRPFTYSGRIADKCPRHTPITQAQLEKLAQAKDITLPPKPNCKAPVRVKDSTVLTLLISAQKYYPTNVWYYSPEDEYFPQYGTPVSKIGTLTAWDPNTDCKGNFMASKWKPNNNCYAYACDRATNTFAQPGRGSSVPVLPSSPSSPSASNSFDYKGVYDGALADGLQYITTDPNITNPLLVEKLQSTEGHVVALFFSEPDETVGWDGDYHFVRYDQKQKTWSQKAGEDQITHFDFAGNPITDPTKANWTRNNGPEEYEDGMEVPYEYFIKYEFKCYLFVPNQNVNIL